jgi:hypothetical protein
VSFDTWGAALLGRDAVIAGLMGLMPAPKGLGLAGHLAAGAYIAPLTAPCAMPNHIILPYARELKAISITENNVHEGGSGES